MATLKQYGGGFQDPEVRPRPSQFVLPQDGVNREPAPQQLGEFGDNFTDPRTQERGGETPRERRATQMGGPMGGSAATPDRPMSPTPLAGLPPVQVTNPLPKPSPTALTSTMRGLGGHFGTQGGLSGGGFGLPFDPTSNNKSDPILTLLQKLQGGF